MLHWLRSIHLHAKDAPVVFVVSFAAVLDDEKKQSINQMVDEWFQLSTLKDLKHNVNSFLGSEKIGTEYNMKNVVHVK